MVNLLKSENPQKLARMFIEQHLQDEIEYIKQQNDDLRKDLNSLKGKEKGLAHRDIKNIQYIRNLEKMLLLLY